MYWRRRTLSARWDIPCSETRTTSKRSGTSSVVKRLTPIRTRRWVNEYIHSRNRTGSPTLSRGRPGCRPGRAWHRFSRPGRLVERPAEALDDAGALDSIFLEGCDHARRSVPYAVDAAVGRL